MLRLGIIDFDSSHCVEFTRRFNHVGVSSEHFVDGARVVLACPGSSLMAPERIPTHLPDVVACGVELVSHPEEMLGRIDGLLVLSICGSAHRARVEPFLKARIPAFVDKPFACSLSDARAMFSLAEEHQTVLWSSSGQRFAEEIVDLRRSEKTYGRILGLVSYGPAKRAPGNPGLFHYGIHATEQLFTLLGPGCQSLTTQYSEGSEVVTGVWRDGRLGTLRGSRLGSTAYGVVAFCERGVVTRTVSTRYSYRNLCREIVRAFETGIAPVPAAETLEIIAFIEAARRSEELRGIPVVLPTAPFTDEADSV